MTTATTATRRFEVEKVRADFPVLRQTAHGKPLVYLDNAATTQKPQVMIDAERMVYETYYSNVHRGVHQLSVPGRAGLRGHPEQAAAVPEREGEPRDRLRPRRHRGHQPGGPDLRPQTRRTPATRS